MNPPNSVTMHDLARKLRLSTMTVSRALRNAPGVSVKTRDRVVEAAKRMNYRPDPALAVLNMYRHNRRKPTTSEKIAFLTNFPTADGWRQSVTFVRYFEGVKKRALQLGYDIEPFWLRAVGMSTRRVSEILHGRGIRGVIVGPLAQGLSSLELEWDLFSAVALGRSLAKPDLALVSVNHYQAMELACREVSAREYPRIGFAITMGEDARTTGALRASFLMQQERFHGPVLPPLIIPDFSADAVTAWVKEHRPDVLLSSEQTHYELLRSRNHRGAASVDFVHLNVDPATDVAGIDQGHDSVGEHALALLHLKLLQRETGVPPRRQMLLISATWKEGKGEWTLRRSARG